MEHQQRRKRREEQLKREGHYDKEWTVREYAKWFCKQDSEWQDIETAQLLVNLLELGQDDAGYKVFPTLLD